MLDVICFGEILWDLFEIGSPRRREPIARAFRRELGGAPANVATGLARLGVRSGVVGGVGRDRFGDALVMHLRADGVAVRFVQRFPNRTGLAFVVRDARGEPDFVFYRHETADLALVADHVTPAMGRARWALVGTSTLMTPGLARATERFLDVAEAARANVFVDLNVRPHLWPDRASMQGPIANLVRRAALIKASDADLRALGERGSGRTWLERNAPRATWIITRGAGRASAIGPHGTVEVAALPGRCVDATGAGDAFIAGALATLIAARAIPRSAAWADPGLWRLALRVGHIMGKKAISRPGAVAGLVNLGRARIAIDSVRRASPLFARRFDPA
jgi:fructokinase